MRQYRLDKVIKSFTIHCVDYKKSLIAKSKTIKKVEYNMHF